MERRRCREGEREDPGRQSKEDAARVQQRRQVRLARKEEETRAKGYKGRGEQKCKWGEKNYLKKVCVRERVKVKGRGKKDSEGNGQSGEMTAEGKKKV